MSSTQNNWFYEHFDTAGTAFGLRLKQKLEEVQTEYQHIEMWETDSFGYLMTIDGATMLTTRDNFLYHEMMAHPARFSHAAPRNVLIIGGGQILMDNGLYFPMKLACLWECARESGVETVGWFSCGVGAKWSHAAKALLADAIENKMLTLLVEPFPHVLFHLDLVHHKLFYLWTLIAGWVLRMAA